MTRLAKYIAAAGYCSRRSASRLIESGSVLVNNQQGTHITRVNTEDQIVINGDLLIPSFEKSYLIYNKPVGIDCVCEQDNKESIIHQINHPIRVFPVGRLDKDSHGLMLLTNDGMLCQRILHPDYYHEKDYLVRVNKVLNIDFLQKMANGVSYKNVKTKPCRIGQISNNIFRITLTQGLNRQIRNMCKTLGYKVIDLQRTRLVNLMLGELPLNKHRVLTPEEKSMLIDQCLGAVDV